MAPTKLTPQTMQMLVRAIEKGLRTKIDICSYADITPSTLNVWERQAEAGDEAAVELFRALDRAKARRKLLYLRKMRQAGDGDWRMWREMLALVDPEEYGKQQQDVKVTAAVETRGQMTYGVDTATAESIFEILVAVGALESNSDESTADVVSA